MNLSFIPDVIYQTKPCKGSNKAEGGDGFQKNLWASEKMRKEQDDTLLVSKPSWSITLLLAEAKMSHSGSLLYKHHCKWGVWKWELVGMHKGNRQSVWDFRPFIIYKMLVAGTANYSTSKESGGLVLLFSWEALCYAALFMCLQGRKLVDLIFCKRWNHYRLMKKWLRWIMAIGEVQEKKIIQSPCYSHICRWKELSLLLIPWEFTPRGKELAGIRPVASARARQREKEKERVAVVWQPLVNSASYLESL